MTYATSADLSLGLVIRPESFPTLCAITQRLCLSVPFQAYCSSVGTQNFTGVLTKNWLIKGENTLVAAAGVHRPTLHRSFQNTCWDVARLNDPRRG